MPKENSESLYEDRIVVFIDILGFKALVNSTLDSDGLEIVKNTNKIKRIFEIADFYFKEHDSLVTSKQISRFSDSIIVSFKYTDKSQVKTRFCPKNTVSHCRKTSTFLE